MAQYDVGMFQPVEAARQGAYLGIQQGQHILNAGSKMAAMDRKNKLQNEINAVNEYNKANGRQTSYEQLLDAYSKYGDPEDVDRVKGKIESRNMSMASTKLGLYMKQYDQAYKSGNNTAISEINANINKDPHISSYVGKVNLTPNGEMSYIAGVDAKAKMKDGNIVDVPTGAVVKGNIENGEFIAQSVEGGSKSAMSKGSGSGIISPGTALAHAQATVDGKPNQYNISMKGFNNSTNVSEIVSDYLMEKDYQEGFKPKVGEVAYSKAMNMVTRGAADNIKRVKNQWVLKNKGKTDADWWASLTPEEQQVIASISK